MEKMSNEWILFSSLLASIFLTRSPFCHGNVDSDALSALKSVLSDPDKVLASWDPTFADPCTWFHITCNADDRVTRVDLFRSNLGGNLTRASSLGNVDQLQYLNLYENNLVGSIPEEIGNLKNLFALDLESNKLTGTIPPLGRLSSLKFLRLNNNRLTGRVPKELADLPNLQVVDLSNNNLCGPIPPGLGHILAVNLANNPRLGKPGPCP